MDFILTVAVDLLFLIIVAISVISAMHKGFLRIVLSLVALVIAFAVASLANEPAAEWCYDSFVADAVIEKVYEVIPEGIDNIESTENKKEI